MAKRRYFEDREDHPRDFDVVGLGARIAAQSSYGVPQAETVAGLLAEGYSLDEIRLASGAAKMMLKWSHS